MTDSHEDKQPAKDFGTLVPKGGGDPIPLLKKNLLIGRRESNADKKNRETKHLGYP